MLDGAILVIPEGSTLAKALELLVQARRFKTESVSDSDELATWWTAVDDLLAKYGDSRQEDRYDDSARERGRKFVERLIHSS